MGKTTKYFRQTNRSMSANNSARNFSKIMRNEGWHIKLINAIRVHGKNNLESK